MTETYKFQKLRVYQLALEYVKMIYALAVTLPEHERYNLGSQIKRAATSIVLNIAEGSTGQSDLEQSRFLGMAIRSYLETIACLDLIKLHEFENSGMITTCREKGQELFIKLNAFRKAIGRRKTGDG
jgi:four helix bundle protein